MPRGKHGRVTPAVFRGRLANDLAELLRKGALVVEATLHRDLGRALLCVRQRLACPHETRAKDEIVRRNTKHFLKTAPQRALGHGSDARERSDGNGLGEMLLDMIQRIVEARAGEQQFAAIGKWLDIWIPKEKNSFPIR